MGLDIYLYTLEQERMNEAHSKGWDELYARFERGEITEQERLEATAKLPDYSHATDVPSEKHGDSLNNRRYLRSSYNDGGFNSAVPKMLGQDRGYYWIFEPLGRDFHEEYSVQLGADDVEKLQACRDRALSVASGLRKLDRPLGVASEGPNVFGNGWPTVTEDEALALYRETASRSTSYSFSSTDGTFLTDEDALTVVALIPGKGVLNEPVVHVVYKMDAEVTESYAVSADIVAEFCDEAIKLIQQDDGCHIHWSG